MRWLPSPPRRRQCNGHLAGLLHFSAPP
jgi:hypothetical protein